MASDFPWTYDSVWELLRTGNFVESCAQDSYYHITRNSNLEKYIATTNYTPMAECILGKETIYLHGKLSWFEDLKKLIVYDCTDESDFFILQQDKNKDIIFPFILIPSGVKPMICKKQIEQFAQFIDQLNQSQYLVIIGYKFHSEDNHINSIVAKWLRCNLGNKLIYFNFASEENANNERIDFQNLAYFQDIESINVCFEDNLKEKLFLPQQILNIKIDSKNARSTYKKCLEELSAIINNTKTAP